MAKITTLGDYVHIPAAGVKGALAAATSGTAIDRLGYDHALIEGDVTATTSSAGTFDLKVQHATGTTASLFTDYTPDYVYGNNNASNTTASIVQQTTSGTFKLDVDLQKANRYIRLVATPGSGDTWTSAVVVALTQREGTVPGATG